MKRPFGKSSLGRREKSRPEARNGIIICYDGERTEHEYFVGWKRALGNQGVVISPYYVKSGGNVLNAVQATIDKTAQCDPSDTVWCVCDVDDTPAESVESAIVLAKKMGVNLALSIRCFEVWIALHWPARSCSPIRTEKDAIRLVAKHYPEFTGKKKSVPFSELYFRTDIVLANADWLRGQEAGNPSTDVHDLIKILRSFIRDVELGKLDSNK